MSEEIKDKMTFAAKITMCPEPLSEEFPSEFRYKLWMAISRNSSYHKVRYFLILKDKSEHEVMKIISEECEGMRDVLLLYTSQHYDNRNHAFSNIERDIDLVVVK